MKIKKLTFNPFQENSYVLYDDTKECIIIDPGCETNSEETVLSSFIEEEGLKPVKLINVGLKQSMIKTISLKVKF